MASNKTYADVVSRAQSALNDENGTFWTAARLLVCAKSAWTKVYGEIAKLTLGSSGNPFRIVVSLNYVANTSDISAILPTDYYLPESLEFRLNTAEEWKMCDPRDPLPSRETEKNDRVFEFEVRSRTIVVNKGTQNGLLRLTYLSLKPEPLATADVIPMDNVVEALTEFTAACAALRRGQVALADARANAGQNFLGLVLDHIVLQMQQVQRRGKSFSGQQ